MPNPSDKDQLEYLATVGLKKAHTDLHQALDRLCNNGSKIEAKKLVADAIKKATEALSVL